MHGHQDCTEPDTKHPCLPTWAAASSSHTAAVACAPDLKRRARCWFILARGAEPSMAMNSSFCISGRAREASMPICHKHGPISSSMPTSSACSQPCCAHNARPTCSLQTARLVCKSLKSPPPQARLRLDDVEQLVQVGEDLDYHLLLRQLHLRVVAVRAVVDDAVLWQRRGGQGFVRRSVGGCDLPQETVGSSRQACKLERWPPGRQHDVNKTAAGWHAMGKERSSCCSRRQLSAV